MSVTIEETIELLLNQDHQTAYKALQELQKESEEDDRVYPYMDRFSGMLDSDSSYIRTRVLHCWPIMRDGMWIINSMNSLRSI